MTDEQIVIEYEHREQEAGGIAHADPRAIAEAVALEHGLSFERVREALSQHWASRGGG